MVPSSVQLGNISDIFFALCYSSDLTHHQVLSTLLPKPLSHVAILLHLQHPKIGNHPLSSIVPAHICSYSLWSILHSVARITVSNHESDPTPSHPQIFWDFALLLGLWLNSLKLDSYFLILASYHTFIPTPIFFVLVLAVSPSERAFAYVVVSA